MWHRGNTLRPNWPISKSVSPGSQFVGKALAFLRESVLCLCEAFDAFPEAAARGDPPILSQVSLLPKVAVMIGTHAQSSCAALMGILPRLPSTEIANWRVAAHYAAAAATHYF